MADRAPTITELIARVGRDPEAVRSVRTLASLHDGPFCEWRSWEFWASLARQWREQAPQRRTRDEAREHYRRVVRALGIRRSQ